MALVSLRGLIVIPFVILAALAGVTVYTLSNVTLSNVSDNVGLYYMQEVESRVYDRVTEFMAPLSVLAELNRDAISHHPEWLDDLDMLAGRFYEQAIPYPYMTFISLATAADGRYINSTRDPFGNASHHVATNYTNSPGSLEAFEYDPYSYVGKHIESEPAYKNYDPRSRPFYQEAVQKQGMVWSSISPYFGYHSLGVGLSVPIYDQAGELLAVTATSVALVSLDNYLQNIDLVDNSYVFLAETNGNLIASSNTNPLYQTIDGAIQRVSLESHQSPVFRQAAKQLEPGVHHVDILDKGYLYNVRAIELPYGQTWLIGVLIPDSYYKGMLAELSEGLLIVVAAIFISIALLGSLIARYIGQPILRLNSAVNAHSLSQIRTLPDTLSHVKEIHSLSQGLQKMAGDLSDVMQNLEQKVAQRTSQLKDENEVLLEQSTTDELTGLHNRRGFNFLSEQARQHAEQHGKPFAMVLCDIDFFKQVNDTHGHNVGDEALSAVAQVLKTNFRESDIIARYGGEEFMLVVAGMEKDELMQRLQSVRQTLVEQPILEDVSVTLSFGVTHLQTLDGKNLGDIIHDVDTKLYQAKNTGRDKIID